MSDQPFTNRPECVKCGGDRVELHYQDRDPAGQRPLLLVTCERCGYEWTMQTKDATR